MSDFIVRTAIEADRDRIKDIAIEAWFPVTRMHPWEARFGALPGRTWQERRRADLDRYLDKEMDHVLVAELDGQVVGFLRYELHCEDLTGEIHLNAVDPGFQNRGIATLLYNSVLQRFRDAGMRYATVKTGISDDYAPARHTYAKAGFEQVYGSIVLGMKL